MKPAETTRSGSKAATASASARSQASRVANSPTFLTKVGMPARSARASPSMASRSAPTATTCAPYAGSARASSSAWRLVPEPETSTTSRAGVGCGTGRSLTRISPTADPGCRAGQSTRAARRPSRRCHQVIATPPSRPPMPKAVIAWTMDVEREGPHVLHPARSDGPARDGGENPEQHAGDDPGDAAAKRSLVPAQGRASAAARGRWPPPRPAPAPPSARRSRPASGRCRAAPPGAGTSAAARSPPRSARRACWAPTAKPGPSR